MSLASATVDIQCDVCHVNKAKVVSAVPNVVSTSAAYCQECTDGNKHPYEILVANTVAMGGLDNSSAVWEDMVLCSLEIADRTMDDFLYEVALGIKEVHDAYKKGQ